MKVTFDRTENRTAFITVEPDAGDLKKYIDKVYKRMAKKAEIPGYPEGDAPHDVIEEYIDKEKALEDAIKELAHEDSSKIIKEHNIENWLQPMVTILQYDPPKYEIAAALKPIVEIADYRKLNVEPEPPDVSDAEVDSVLERQRIQIGTLTAVERPVQSGDLLVLDIEGNVEGKTFMSKKYSRFYVDENFVPEMPGLWEKLVGAKKEEDFGFKLALPGEYSDKSAAGKTADFSVRIHDIRELVLDEINDDFAKKVAPGVPSLEELKKRIRYNLAKEKEMNADTRFKEKIVATLIEESHIEYPAMLVELQANQLVEDFKQQMKSSVKDENEYKEKLGLIAMDKIKESSMELAKKRVLWTLVLDEVAKAEGITVSDDEIAEEIDRMTDDIQEEIKQKESRRRLHTYERENVTDVIKVRKTVNRLAEIITGKEQSEAAE